MKRQLWTMVGAIASIALALGVVALPADAATRPYCGLRWGSLQKQIGRGPGFPPSPLVGVRAGRHACFDRLVFDHDGVIAGGAVRYVSRVTTEAVGDPVPLRGGAFLQIVLYAPTNDLDGRPTFSPRDPADLVSVSRFRTFRQVADGGSFEGYTTVGLGVRARLPFRVFVLRGPGSQSRLVVDVAHRW